MSGEATEGALIVRWSAARQVTAELGWPERSWPPGSVGVVDHYRILREGGEVETAVTFLAAALPRQECVAWAAHLLERAAEALPHLPARSREALDRARAWVANSGEAARRAARAAGEAADADSPERMLAAAIFYSGGSIAPAGMEPVNPPAGVSGRMAAAGIILAAHRSGNAAAIFASALDLGEAIAERGLAAVPPTASTPTASMPE